MIKKRLRWTDDLVDNWLVTNQSNIIRLDSFISVNVPIRWKCSKCNNVWQTAWQHIYSKGTQCPKCRAKSNGEKSRLSLQEVDNRLQARNIIRQEIPITTDSKIKWKCKIDNYEWISTVSSIIHNKSGCPKCASTVRLTNELMDEYLLIDNLIIRKGNVINNKTPIDWLCKKCNSIWKTTPSKIKNQKTRCPICFGNKKLSNQEVDLRLKRLKIPIFRVGNYVSTHISIEWKCEKCSLTWMARPSNVLTQHTGCPYCRTPSYSKIAIHWIKTIENQHQIRIQHAEQGGEYTIPGTKIKVDGFCKETNTVYEFYGDIFHGNPSIFNNNDMCSPYHTLTAGQLYTKTKQKEELIKQKGFNLITIWENEYAKQRKP